MSLDTHMFTWLISGAVTYHTSDGAAFPEADGLYSAMMIFMYDVQNPNGFIQRGWFYDRSRLALFCEGPQLQHYDAVSRADSW